MNISNSPVQCLTYRDYSTWIIATALVAGNIILPQIVHLIPQGGLIWLPIYFFTLVGAYKWGWQVGILTALLSPTLNHLFFGMPSSSVLPVIIMKSSVLAVSASIAARVAAKVSIVPIAMAIIAYQLVGGIAELVWTGSAEAALQDIRIGIPGLVVQLFGSYILLKYFLKD